ncbi:phage baseplate assembly protein V [Nocardioides litoris]|uniref:phage baseplate assembly protein V n=1 Tax=Nocardioides litoris TaxID=1926648 RepID=UPI001124B1E6|nr:phage baseplate assembly protein V [Nocardioides litoris]
MPPPLAPVVEVNGRPLTARTNDALTSLRIDLGLGLPGRAVLRFVDTGYEMATSALFPIAADVEVRAGGTTLLSGEVTAIALEQGDRPAPELVVTVDDRACRLGRGTQNKAFTNHSHSDLVSKMASAAGLSLGGQDASVLPKTQLPYVLQAGTHLAMLQEICARAGLVWWVQGKQLKIAAAGAGSGTATLRLGTPDLTSFSVRATATGPEKVEVRGWNPDQQAAITGTYETKRTKESEFVASAAGRKAATGVTTAVALAADRPLDAAEADTLAKARFAEAASASVVATGTGVVAPALTLTTAVTVDNAGPASGTYRLSRIEHTYNRSGFTTRFTAGPVRPSGLVDLLGGSRPSAGLDVPGVHPAVVSDVKDPDNKGRVKVTWKVVDDLVESAWGRIVTLGAGKSRGMVLFPEVGDEVLVAFEHGDSRRPVVLGGLYSTKNTLPSADTLDQDKVKFRRITSRLGHVVELADGTSPAEQHVLITLEGKKDKIRLGKDQVDVVSDGTPIKLTNGQASITLAKNGDVTIEGNNIELKAKSEIKLTATSKVTVKGNAGVAVQGAQVQVKADGVGSVEASGPLTLKGATVAIN